MIRNHMTLMHQSGASRTAYARLFDRTRYQRTSPILRGTSSHRQTPITLMQHAMQQRTRNNIGFMNKSTVPRRQMPVESDCRKANSNDNDLRVTFSGEATRPAILLDAVQTSPDRCGSSVAGSPTLLAITKLITALTTPSVISENHDFIGNSPI